MLKYSYICCLLCMSCVISFPIKDENHSAIYSISETAEISPVSGVGGRR